MKTQKLVDLLNRQRMEPSEKTEEEIQQFIHGLRVQKRRRQLVLPFIASVLTLWLLIIII